MCCFTQIFSYPIPALRSSRGFPEPLVVFRWSHLQQISFQQTFLASPWTHISILHHIIISKEFHITQLSVSWGNFSRFFWFLLASFSDLFYTFSVICFQAEKSWPMQSFRNIPCFPLLFPNFNKHSLLQGSASAAIHTPCIRLSQWQCNDVVPFVLFSNIWFHVVSA